MYWLYPTSQKQIWQRLPAGNEGQDPQAGGATQHRGPEAFPPRCSAGKVKLVFGFDLVPWYHGKAGFPLFVIPMCSQLKGNLAKEKLLNRYLMESKPEKIELT